MYRVVSTLNVYKKSWRDGKRGTPERLLFVSPSFNPRRRLFALVFKRFRVSRAFQKCLITFIRYNIIIHTRYFIILRRIIKEWPKYFYTYACIHPNTSYLYILLYFIIILLLHDNVIYLVGLTPYYNK